MKRPQRHGAASSRTSRTSDPLGDDLPGLREGRSSIGEHIWLVEVDVSPKGGEALRQELEGIKSYSTLCFAARELARWILTQEDPLDLVLVVRRAAARVQKELGKTLVGGRRRTPRRTQGESA